MAAGYFSDDSDFYGDEATIKQLKKRSKEADVKKYWDTHDRNINVVFPPVSTISSSPPLPKGGLHNRWEGRDSAWQSHETIDDFLSRLPVLSSSWVGPWLWVANPYAERDAEPEGHGAEFTERAQDLLSDFLDHKNQVTEENPGAAQGVITRKLKPARDKLKEDLLTAAKETGLVCGKWMLFPGEDDAPGIWKRVAAAVIENKLGVGAKIATAGDTRLICVYTRDFSDEADVKRVVQQLETMELLPGGERSIYYKCDAYTELDIMSQNEYGLQASLYASKDVLAGKTAPKSRAAAGDKKGQKRIADFVVQSKAAGKRKNG